MNETTRDIVLVAIAVGIGYFIYKEVKAKKAATTTYSAINQLVNGNSTANQSLTTTQYVSEAESITNAIFGPSPDGSN